jgi:hypothetical protein
MTQDRLTHPTDEALRALSLGHLTEAEIEDVSTHLGGCPVCCHRIDQLATAADDPLLARLQRSANSAESLSQEALRAVLRRMQPHEAAPGDPPDPP